MSGSARGRQLYQMMAEGEAVPNEVVNDLLAETMVKKAASNSKVRQNFRANPRSILTVLVQLSQYLLVFSHLSI